MIRTAALVGAATLATVIATAPADAASVPAPIGAGYVASPAKAAPIRMTLVVPTIACGPASTTSITAGMYGTVDDTVNGHTVRSPWSLTVTAACQDGKARYHTVAGMPVRAGDHVRLIQSNAETYEVDDLTAGTAEGGGTAGTGRPPTLEPQVLFGVRVTNGVRRTTQVTVLGARTDKVDLDQVKHARQEQFHGKQAVATPARLRSPGAFVVTVEQT